MRTELPITSGFYESYSLQVSNQQCKNFYAQDVERGGLAKTVLFGTPGMRELVNTGNVLQTNRGAHVKANIPYFVNGESLYRVDRAFDGTTESFTYVLLGAIEGTERVSLADNGDQLMILVPGGKGYIYNESVSPALQEITDSDFRANGEPQYCAYIDGYFVVTTDSKKFIVSALGDGLSWNALDFGSAEADPDDIVAPIVLNNQLFIAGRETIEAFQNIGGAAFPFQRIQGFVMPKGVFAANSLIKAGDTFVFVGGGTNETASIYAFAGNSVARISTDGIDAILDSVTPEDIAESFAMYYSQSKADFACFTVSNRTFVYNFVNGKWHERTSRIVTDTETVDTRWRANSIISAYNLILVGDSQDGRIGELSRDCYCDYGTNIIREVSTMPFANQGKAFTVPYLELTMESGVGNGEDEDPKVRLSRSRDGKTFDDSRARSVGRIGEYERRCIWRRMGRVGRFEVFKFQFSAKAKPVIIKLEADIVGLAR